VLASRRAPSLLSDPGSLTALGAPVGLVSSAEVSNRISSSRYHARRDVTRSRSRGRDVVTLVGRSAGLRMCER
jgi:hypothetical protein